MNDVLIGMSLEDGVCTIIILYMCLCTVYFYLLLFRLQMIIIYLRTNNEQNIISDYIFRL